MDPLIRKLGPRWDVSGQLQRFGLKFAVCCWMCVTVTGMALPLKY